MIQETCVSITFGHHWNSATFKEVSLFLPQPSLGWKKEAVLCYSSKVATNSVTGPLSQRLCCVSPLCSERKGGRDAQVLTTGSALPQEDIISSSRTTQILYMHPFAYSRSGAKVLPLVSCSSHLLPEEPGKWDYPLLHNGQSDNPKCKITCSWSFSIDPSVFSIVNRVYILFKIMYGMVSEG